MALVELKTTTTTTTKTKTPAKMPFILSEEKPSPGSTLSDFLFYPPLNYTLLTCILLLGEEIKKKKKKQEGRKKKELRHFVAKVCAHAV